MSYGLKYIAKAYGLSSVQWKVELYEKDYVPSVGETPIELNLVGDGIKIGNDREDDRFNVIYSRYATIDLKATDTFDINVLQFDDEQKYQVKIYQGSTLDFIGWLIPFYSSQEFEDTVVTTISIQAKDGIKQRLKNKNFVNEHPEVVSNKQSVKDIICQCIRQVGYNSNVEIYYNKYESSMFKTSSDCPLAQLYFNVTALEKDSNTNITYYDVLTWILEVHGLSIKQVYGVWRILNQVEVIDGSVTGRVYDYNGTYLGNNTLITDLVISKIKRGALIRKDIPFQQFSAFYQANSNINILANGKFDQFVGLDPVNWTKVGSWSIGQVSTILDSNGIQFNNTYTTDEGIDTKYFESSAIDITGLSSFTFKAEAYADSDIDSVKIAIILYNSSDSSYTYYVDKYGSIKSIPVTALIDKGQTDRYIGFDLSFITNSATQYLNGVDRIKIRIYPGVRLRDGVPTNKKVKYRNLVLTGQANSYDADFLGRVYEYKNTDLPSSKVADEFTVNFQDNLNTNVAVFRNTFFIGDTNNVTSSWKRTGESDSYTLIESLLIDRLSLTAKFNDIFEGEAIGYIDHTKTPLLLSESKRYLVLHYEYNLQQNTTELVLVELASSSVNFSKKIYDRYKDDKTIDVSDGKGSSNIAGNEAFDATITSNGGTMYGGVFLDWGIDAIPSTSTDPRATNKGVLKVGPEYAQTLELGNRANDTLVDVLGRLSLANNVFYDNGFPLDDGSVLPRLGLNSSELFVEGDFHTYGKYLVNNGLLTLTTETYSVEDNISAGVVSAENERLLLRGAKGIEAQNDFYIGKSYLSNEDIYSGGVFTSSRLRANTDEFQIPGNLNFDTNSKLKINGSFGADHTFLKSVGDRMEWKDMTVGEITDINDNYVDRLTAQGIDGVKTFNDDVILGGRLKVAGSFGADHYFLKSNGTTQEWAEMNVGEIADIYNVFATQQDAVLYGTFEGERGFKLYHDINKLDTAALFFANQDTGVVGIHYYGLNNDNQVTQHGIHIDGDGFVYHRKINGNRARFLTTDDNLGTSYEFNGGTVSTKLDFQFLKKTNYLASNGTTIIHSQYATNIGTNAFVENTNGIRLISGDSVQINAINHVAINDVSIDLSDVPSLVGSYGRFLVSSTSGGYNILYKIKLVAA